MGRSDDDRHARLRKRSSQNRQASRDRSGVSGFGASSYTTKHQAGGVTMTPNLHLIDVLLKDRRDAGKKLLTALGYKRIVGYVKETP